MKFIYVLILLISGTFELKDSSMRHARSFQHSYNILALVLKCSVRKYGKIHPLYARFLHISWMNLAIILHETHKILPRSWQIFYLGRTRTAALVFQIHVHFGFWPSIVCSCHSSSNVAGPRLLCHLVSYCVCCVLL